MINLTVTPMTFKYSHIMTSNNIFEIKFTSSYKKTEKNSMQLERFLKRPMSSLFRLWAKGKTHIDINSIKHNKSSLINILLSPPNCLHSVLSLSLTQIPHLLASEWSHCNFLISICKTVWMGTDEVGHHQWPVS